MSEYSRAYKKHTARQKTAKTWPVPDCRQQAIPQLRALNTWARHDNRISTLYVDVVPRVPSLPPAPHLTVRRRWCMSPMNSFGVV